MRRCLKIFEGPEEIKPLVLEIFTKLTISDKGVDSHNSLRCLFSIWKVGSPSALADADLNQGLRQAAHKYNRTLYVPSGALWGGQDIQRMNDSGKLKVRVQLCSR